MTLNIALIRQEQTGGDGGAQAIIDLILQALGETQDIKLSLLCRQWESSSLTIAEKVIIDPPFKGRKNKQTTFNQGVIDYIKQHPFDLIQSHERLNGCHIFRAGDGLHKVWLQKKSLRSNYLQRWWTSRSSYHQALLTEEKQMFESTTLKKVICNSNMVKQEILQHFTISEEKIAIIYNGVDTKKYFTATLEQKLSIRTSLGIPKNALTFIFAGSGFERKNLLTTLQAFSQLNPNCHLLVVGRDKHQQRYEKLAKRLHCLPRVHFLGSQNRQAMPRLYQAADVLVLPTLYDPFPNVILEGLACGLPCITSSACGAIDIIPDNNCGTIVEPTDTEALIAAMSKYYDQETLSKESHCATVIANNFTQDVMQQKFLQLYRDLLEAEHA